MTVCDAMIFADAFESGDTSAWSSTVPPTPVVALVPNRASSELRVYRGSFPIDVAGARGARGVTRYHVKESRGGPVRLAFDVEATQDRIAVRPWTLDATGEWRAADVVVASATRGVLEFEEIAATGPGSADGLLRIFIDGDLAGTVGGLSNSAPE